MMTRDYVFLSLLWGSLGSSAIAGLAAYLVFFIAPYQAGASVYLLVAIFTAVNSCLGVIVYREWRQRQFDRWVGMNSPRWTVPTWKNPPGAFDLGFKITQVDPVKADGRWQAELYGLSQILPGRPELTWVMGVGRFHGEAIANLWQAIHALQMGDAKPPDGTLWGHSRPWDTEVVPE